MEQAPLIIKGKRLYKEFIMGLAHGKWRKTRETREKVGVVCLGDECRERWAEGEMMQGWHDLGIKSPIKLHGGILIYRLMSYCVTNHSQPF